MKDDGKKINERYSYDDPYNFVAKLEKKTCKWFFDFNCLTS